MFVDRCLTAETRLCCETRLPQTRIIDFHEILFFKFVGGCSISAVTRELSRASVMQLVHVTPRRSFTNIVPRRSLPPNFETRERDFLRTPSNTLELYSRGTCNLSNLVELARFIPRRDGIIIRSSRYTLLPLIILSFLPLVSFFPSISAY